LKNDSSPYKKVAPKKPMNATKQRNRASSYAKKDPGKALELARAIDESWFKAQALSWIARFSKDDTLTIAKEASEAAALGDDAYKKSAVRAWEIAALAERDFLDEAKTALLEALAESKSVEPNSSRAEALISLLRAALRIDRETAESVVAELTAACGDDPFWRCKRAIKDANDLMAGEEDSRKFFW
jgi:hypothetical protein